MAQQAKDPELSLQRLGSLLWQVFVPWSRNFHMLGAWTRKEKKEKTVKGISLVLSKTEIQSTVDNN